MADVSNENRDYKYSEDEGFEGYEYIPEEGDDGLNENDIASRALAVLGHFSGKRNSRNERHGFGRTILPNGDAYVGMYTNDQRQGYGEYIFKNGGKYNGCYKHNLRNGNGIMHYPDKSKYDGQWYDNDKDGVGTFTYNNGDKYQGSWKCDMKHGVGTYSFCKSKAVLKGVWSNGKRVSNFEFYFPTSDESGFTFHGVWDDNENVAGEGYFVFEDLMCMQRGIHVNNNNYYSLNSNNVWLSTDMHGNTGPLWFSNKIMPIVTSMLPKLPKEKPSLNKNQSSCEIIMKISEPSVFSRVSTAPSPMEIYERKHNLWNEMNEHESGEGVDAEQNINENRAYSSSLDKD